MYTQTLTIRTEKFFHIVDITSQVEDFLATNNLEEGIVNIFSQHTTIAIKINEKEDGFYDDLENLMLTIAPREKSYKHNDLENRDPATICQINKEECLNGHSHLMQMLLGSTSESIPVKGGKMQLGRWQRILLIELDHARERNVLLSFCK